MRAALLGVLASCADPEMDRYRDALGAYDAGVAATERGDWPAALASFDRAVALDPGSAALASWRASAQARSGDEAGALDYLDAAVLAHPDSAELRYPRAALRAQAGDLRGSADDLVYLYMNELVEPTVAGDDPDFAPLAADPELAFLVPPSAVRVEARPPDGEVLLGEPWTLALTVSALAGRSLSVQLDGDPHPLLDHRRTVEDVLGGAGRMVTREITVTWRAVQPGEAQLGPWRLSDGRSEAVLGPFALQVVSLGSPRAATAGSGEQWSLPSSLLAGHEPPWAGRVGDALVVQFAAGTRGELVGTTADPVLLELRESGQPAWLAGAYPAGSTGTARVTRGSEVLLEQVLQ